MHHSPSSARSWRPRAHLIPASSGCKDEPTYLFDEQGAWKSILFKLEDGDDIEQPRFDRAQRQVHDLLRRYGRGRRHRRL